MRWIEKRPKGPDANVKQKGALYEVRGRLKLPDGRLFVRELTAGSKTAARKLRDDVYAAYNELALEVLAGKPPEPAKAVPAPDAIQFFVGAAASIGGTNCGKLIDALTIR